VPDVARRAINDHEAARVATSERLLGNAVGRQLEVVVGRPAAKGLTSFTRWVARRLRMNHYLGSLLRSM
jgi:hypothetical protein